MGQVGELKQAMQAWWSPVSNADVRTITRQLGKAPRGVLAIARRCRFGSPQVIVCSPVVLGPGRRSEKKAGVGKGDLRVFPTTYWLTCSYLVAAVGQLEGAGWVRQLSHWSDEAELVRQMAAAHQRAADERIALVDPRLGALLQAEQPNQWQVLTQAGIGGARSPRGVKCLHLHLADYLAGPVGDERPSTAATGERNPVGARVLALLLQHGCDVTGRPGCHGCSGACLSPETAEDAGSEPLIAAFDVGTNSCRGLCCRVADDQPVVTGFALRTTRLGEGLQETGLLAQNAIERTIAGLGELQEELHLSRSGMNQRSQVIAVGTNAVRSAKNSADFLIKAWEELGLAVRALPSEEEARLSFQGALAGLIRRDDEKNAAGVSERPILPEPVLVLDIGGGSTELVSGSARGAVNWCTGANIGAVRLFELYKRGLCRLPADAVLAPWEAEGPEELTLLIRTAEHYLRRELRLPQEEWLMSGTLVGVGGTCTSLAAIDLRLEKYRPEIVQGHRLSLESIIQIGRDIASLSLAKRRRIVGLRPQIGDIILAGVALVIAAMRITGHTELLVSDAGILLGLIHQYFNACIRKKNEV